MPPPQEGGKRSLKHAALRVATLASMSAAPRCRCAHGVAAPTAAVVRPPRPPLLTPVHHRRYPVLMVLPFCARSQINRFNALVRERQRKIAAGEAVPELPTQQVKKGDMKLPWTTASS